MGKVVPGSFVAALCLALASCKDAPSAATAHPYQSPDQYAGGTRGGGRQASPDYAWMKQQEKELAEKKEAEQRAEEAKAMQEADSLWKQAEAERDPDDAADLYRKIAEDHKDSPRAEEARWREASKRYEDRDWNSAVAALDTYTKDYPINPHLRDAERMLYESSVHVFEEARGFKGIFKSDKKGYDGLNAIVDRFAQGSYPDDALMSLGEQHARKDEWPEAALQYHNLLLRYPDSEWSFKARLRLGDAYLARDHGPEYHPGYIDIDPRVAPSPQAAAMRPVKSCVEAALSNYDAFLERIAADPARRGEYAADVAYAREQSAECRRRLAEKDRTIAAYYARRGQAEAAATCERFAQNVEAGRPWCAGLCPPAPSPATAPPAIPPPAVDRPVTPPPTPPAPPPPAPPPPTPPPPAPPPPTPPPPAPPPPTPPPQTPPTAPPPAVGPGNPSASAPPSPGALPPPRRTSRDTVVPR